MKVALNATALLSPLTGIGQYTYHLAKGLQALPELELDLFYGSGWSKEVRDQPVPSIAAIKSLVKRFMPNAYSVNRFLQQNRFTRGVQANRADIYHEPNFLAFKFNGPSVITVHDLSWIRFPDTHPVERVRAMNTYFEPGLRRAALILTDSEFVKRELMDVFGVKAERIRPVLLGVESLFHPRTAEDTLPVLNRLDLVHGQYLLAVGTLEPRKNLQVALRAYMLLPQQVRKHFPLVLVGMSGWHTSELEQQIAPLVRAGGSSPDRLFAPRRACHGNCRRLDPDLPFHLRRLWFAATGSDGVRCAGHCFGRFIAAGSRRRYRPAH